MLVTELSCDKDQPTRHSISLAETLAVIHKPGKIFTDNSEEFIRACQDHQWTHDMKSPPRSEPDDIAARAVRPVKEGEKRR